VAVTGQALVGGGADVLVTGDVLGGDDEAVATLQSDRSRGEGAETDLRALQVDQDADRAARLVGGLAQVEVPGLVLGVRAVRQVQPADVEAGGDQGLQLLGGFGRGAESTDDFRATHESDPIPYPAVTIPERAHS